MPRKAAKEARTKQDELVDFVLGSIHKVIGEFDAYIGVLHLTRPDSNVAWAARISAQSVWFAIRSLWATGCAYSSERRMKEEAAKWLSKQCVRFLCKDEHMDKVISAALKNARARSRAA